MPDARRQATPSIDRLEAQMRLSSPVFRDAVARSRAKLGEDWAIDFDDAIARLLPDASALVGAVRGYSRFALDALRLQATFEKEGVYASKSFADVEAEVYGNAEYMTECYLPGLLLSHYLWPHHYRQSQFFRATFVADMIRAAAERFYDVGVGTGVYSRLALVASDRTMGLGIDISPSSKAFAERHASAFGVGGHYSVELRDVIADPPPPLDWVICVEVIEHLEDPVSFLKVLRSMVRPGGKAFIGTAMNAANADHIYLYRTPEDVRIQMAEAGFAVEQYLCAASAAPRNPAIPVPEVIAFVVT